MAAYTAIDNPAEYFNTVLYTGNGSTNAITGVGFQPDLVWCKNRASSKYHGLYDSVRGTGTSKSLASNSNEAEGANANFINLTAFGSDGFTLGATSNTNQINTSGENHVAWNWLAGGSASSNSNGSITSSVSANTTAGFSIVSYTGTGSNATVGHGLGVAPSFVIVKDRGNSLSWPVSGDNIGWNKNNYLDSDQAVQTANHFQDTAPTSSLMYLATDIAVNGSSRNYIMYCFADTGNKFFKAGSYVGNGNVDAPFLFCGMLPSFLMIKRTDTTSNWVIFDNKRGSYNEINNSLYPNSNGAEDTDTSLDDVDFVSNGVKIREDSPNINASGGTYIFMAFAEAPFVNSNGVPCNAR